MSLPDSNVKAFFKKRFNKTMTVCDMTFALVKLCKNFLSCIFSRLQEERTSYMLYTWIYTFAFGELQTQLQSAEKKIIILRFSLKAKHLRAASVAPDSGLINAVICSA